VVVVLLLLVLVRVWRGALDSAHPEGEVVRVS
jgi:hypothetical protein